MVFIKLNKHKDLIYVVLSLLLFFYTFLHLPIRVRNFESRSYYEFAY